MLRGYIFPFSHLIYTTRDLCRCCWTRQQAAQVSLMILLAIGHTRGERRLFQGRRGGEGERQFFLFTPNIERYLGKHDLEIIKLAAQIRWWQIHTVR